MRSKFIPQIFCKYASYVYISYCCGDGFLSFEQAIAEWRHFRAAICGMIRQFLSFKSTLGLVLFTTVFADDVLLLILLVKTKTSSLDEAHRRLDA